MKTTVQIPESLFDQARQVAQREQTTLKALVEEGLRRVVADRQRSAPFHLRDAAFQGNGIQPGLAGASWAQIRDMSYEGRGG